MYGLGQNASFLIPNIVNQMKQGNITIKDQQPKRDYVHIDDAVQSIILAIDYNETGFETFNLGHGVSNSVQEVVEIIRKQSGKEFNVDCTNEVRKGEILDTLFNNSKLKQTLGWTPEVTFEEGVKRVIEDIGDL